MCSHSSYWKLRVYNVMFTPGHKHCDDSYKSTGNEKAEATWLFV